MNSPYWASGASPGLAALGLQGFLLEEILFLFSSLKIAIQCNSYAYTYSWPDRTWSRPRISLLPGETGALWS